jgi:hypothetical protein
MAHGRCPDPASRIPRCTIYTVQNPPGPSRPASCSAGSTIRCWVSIHRCQKRFDRSTARSPSALDAALCPFGSKVQARASQVSSERGSARRKAIVAWMAVDLSTLPVCQCQCQPSLQARAAQDRTKPLLYYYLCTQSMHRHLSSSLPAAPNTPVHPPHEPHSTATNRLFCSCLGVHCVGIPQGGANLPATLRHIRLIVAYPTRPHV